MKIFLPVIALLMSLETTAFAAGADIDYNDPGMHYTPPADWENVLLAPSAGIVDEKSGDSPDSDVLKPVAVYSFHRGKPDQRTIVISVKEFDGPLDAFDRATESDTHTQSDGAFIDKPIKMTLANGMPVDLLKIDSGSDPGHFTERFEYLIIDGTRGITISYGGRQGDFTQKDALDAFTSLYVVRYPRHQA
jgi:hypothetical protein